MPIFKEEKMVVGVVREAQNQVAWRKLIYKVVDVTIFEKM
jgi:hypothetical protein